MAKKRIWTPAARQFLFEHSLVSLTTLDGSGRGDSPSALTGPGQSCCQSVITLPSAPRGR
jgi:hypothetical protein